MNVLSKVCMALVFGQVALGAPKGSLLVATISDCFMGGQTVLTGSCVGRLMYGKTMMIASCVGRA